MTAPPPVAAPAAGRALSPGRAPTAPAPSPCPTGAPSPGAPQRAGRRWWPWLVVSPLLALLGLVALVVLLLAGAAQQSCAPGSPALGGGSAAPGSLGGVAGTGLSPAQVTSVRRGSPYAGTRVTAGRYSATSYGPPWGGIQGAGIVTSGGLVIAGGTPRWYMIAADPLLIAHGTLVRAWPNPFRWRGAFLAADTGGAIQGRRIDFYDWRGRVSQHQWGRRPVTIQPASSSSGAAAPIGGACAPAAASAVGERIGQLARAQLGRGPNIPGFAPPSVGYAWCAWFATNVWREAGVPIPVNAWSGYTYTWAQAKGQLFKAVGQRPRSVTPPVGSALMYGTEARPGGDSRHVNLVDRVLADGSFMVTGGNQDSSRVTRYGPCRLTRTDPAQLVGPGCDQRPIYGIATPTPDRT